MAADPHPEGGEGELGGLVPYGGLGGTLDGRKQPLPVGLDELQQLPLVAHSGQIGKDSPLLHDQLIALQAAGSPDRDGPQLGIVDAIFLGHFLILVVSAKRKSREFIIFAAVKLVNIIN